MRTYSRSIGIVGVSLALGLAAISLIHVANAAAAADGDKCTVTAGPNKGKTGTYTDGGTWCEGSFGGTECKDQSKCKAALVQREGYQSSRKPDNSRVTE